jgi:hypothetical protein
MAEVTCCSGCGSDTRRNSGICYRCDSSCRINSFIEAKDRSARQGYDESAEGMNFGEQEEDYIPLNSVLEREMLS